MGAESTSGEGRRRPDTSGVRWTPLGAARSGASPSRILLAERTRVEIFAMVLNPGSISRTPLAQRLGLASSGVTRMLPPLLSGTTVSDAAGDCRIHLDP